MESFLKLIATLASAAWDQRHRITAVLKLLATRTWASITTLALILMGSSLLLLYIQRSQRYEAVVSNVLNNGRRFQDEPALQALLLSSLEGDAVDDLKGEKLDSSFEQNWNQLVTDAETALSTEAKDVNLIVGSPGGDTLTEYYDPKQAQRIPGYLFAPYFLITPPLDRVHEQQVLSEAVPLRITPIDDPHPSTEIIEATSPSIYRQIVLSRAIAESMQKLAGIPMISEKSRVAHLLAAVPVQAYVVLSGGITRVFIHDDPTPTMFFGSQFPATTFFPSRPYFWPTFTDHPSFYTHITSSPSEDYRERTEHMATLALPSGQPYFPSEGSIFTNTVAADTTIGEFFRVSEPYLDLGGSGVVVTLTRGLIIDGVGKAVICIDLRFDDNNGVWKVLNKTINSLNGKVYSLQCDVSKASQHLICANEQAMPPAENDLFYRVKNEFLRSPTEVLSNLYRFDDESSIRFSLPLDRTINGDGSQRLTLILASLDPTLYKAHTSTIAFSAATAFGLLTAFIAYLWGSLEVGWSRYSSAFSEVDKVMEFCPLPYARLDTEDHIIAANQAFVDLFAPGRPMKDLAVTTLRSMCFDEESRRKYDEVEVLRKKHEEVAPYDLILRTHSGSPITTTVHSAAIPSEVRDLLPGTFGILIPKPLQAQ